MKILHIVPDFIRNKVFADMISALSTIVDNQVVFIPIAKHKYFKRNNVFLLNVRMVYSKCFGIIDRVLFLPKVNKIYSSIMESSLTEEIDLVHAHTLVSAGSVAYKEFCIHRTPYVVTVNSTDVNIFLKRIIFLKHHIKNILVNASAILFLNNNLCKSILDVYGKEVVEQLKDKSFTIPFGLNNIWRTTSKKNVPKVGAFKVLFIGDLNDNKNILGVIEAVKRLNNTAKEIILGIAGDGKYRRRVRKLTSQFDWITYFGYIGTTEKLIELYDSYDCLVLPSFKESFGMVYIEALSRGLPIVYSRGQGIDGYFLQGIAGVAVNQYRIDSICEAILKLRRNYWKYSGEALNISKKFTWERSVSDHVAVYKKATKSLI